MTAWSMNVKRSRSTKEIGDLWIKPAWTRTKGADRTSCSGFGWRTDECLTGLIISGLQNCFMPSIAHYSRRHAVSSEEGRLLPFYWANIVNHWILIFYILPE